MTDLERLFRRLVDNLIAIDPARLHRPMPLADLLDSVIPYRTTRRALQVDSAEDYDMLILRLCAGEGGYVRMVADEISQLFQEQATSPNPDLSVLRDYNKAELVLGTEPLAHALGPGPDEAYAPPEPPAPEPVEELIFPSAIEPAVPEPPARRASEPPAKRRGADVVPLPFTAEPTPPASPPMMPPPPRMTAEPEPSTRHGKGPRCSYCGGALPTGRPVNFCPPLRPEPGAHPLPRVPGRDGDRLAALHQLRARHGRGIAAPFLPHSMHHPKLRGLAPGRR